MKISSEVFLQVNKIFSKKLQKLIFDLFLDIYEYIFKVKRRKSKKCSKNKK